MKQWLLVAGDFTPLGGMDAANHALARYLAAEGAVHLVTHRAWADLHALPSVSIRCVRRPFGRHALGSGLLARAGEREWKRLQPLGAQPIVNGGNCRIPGAVNWVHYLHAAYRPTIATSALGRAKGAVLHRRDLAAERTALVEAPLVICNSRRTRDDVVEHVGIDRISGAGRVLRRRSRPLLARDTGATRRGAGAHSAGRPIDRSSPSSARSATGARHSIRCLRRGCGCAAIRSGTRISSLPAAAQSNPRGSVRRESSAAAIASASSVFGTMCPSFSPRSMRWFIRPATKRTDCRSARRCAAGFPRSSVDRRASPRSIRGSLDDLLLDESGR